MRPQHLACRRLGPGSGANFRYLTLNGLGYNGSGVVARLNAFFGPSSADYAFQAVPYPIETDEVTADCTVSFSNLASNVMTSGTVGGNDPYTVTGSGTASFQASSTYRLLTAPQTAPAGALTASVVIPSTSYAKWAPLNGTVVSVGGSTANILNGVFTADQFPNQKATIAYYNLVCQPSAVSGETINVAYNAGVSVPTPSALEFHHIQGR